ncbi:unnamed protein product [Gongylonema pulchrum]|uniref:Transcription factor n=1 Tax=Gongylonema pulchrum TaxID=637853 RepID=A0A183ESS2_9BILA|nr:unnamed protein product [Gongylonema pulchrum]VDN42275.1 unnamed protein product [Gongylonema pulchrum]
MNLLDPRQLLMNPFTYSMVDPATMALLNSVPGTQSSSAGKITTNSTAHSLTSSGGSSTTCGTSNSFRISDILDSSDDKANTSGENG